MTRIYLDNNATTFMLPEVADVVWESSCQGLGNPASQHDLGARLAGGWKTLEKPLEKCLEHALRV